MEVQVETSSTLLETAWLRALQRLKPKYERNCFQVLLSISTCGTTTRLTRTAAPIPGDPSPIFEAGSSQEYPPWPRHRHPPLSG